MPGMTPRALVRVELQQKITQLTETCGIVGQFLGFIAHFFATPRDGYVANMCRLLYFSGHTIEYRFVICYTL